MTVEQLVQTINAYWGLIVALGSAVLALLVVWLRVHFYPRKDGKALSAKVAVLEDAVRDVEDSIKHQPSRKDFADLSAKITELQRQQDRNSEKMHGVKDMLEQVQKQNSQIYGCLMDRRGNTSFCSGD